MECNWYHEWVWKLLLWGYLILSATKQFVGGSETSMQIATKQLTSASGVEMVGYEESSNCNNVPQNMVWSSTSIIACALYTLHIAFNKMSAAVKKWRLSSYICVISMFSQGGLPLCVSPQSMSTFHQHCQTKIIQYFQVGNHQYLYQYKCFLVGCPLIHYEDNTPKRKYCLVIQSCSITAQLSWLPYLFPGVILFNLSAVYIIIVVWVSKSKVLGGWGV